MSLDYHTEPRDQQHLLWNDRIYDDLRATDGVDISSRRKHREYMKRNNLTVADDYRNEWKQAAKRRVEFFAGRDPTRREDIERSIHKLEKRK